MALRGTLSDFGIPDIFQLVGHQTKTGVLLLKNREQEVRISFVEGNVVKAEKSSRDRADLLGNLMVRARVLSDSDLEDALTAQQRTMRRLGDVLVEKGYVTLDVLKEFTRLQTTETIYRLFVWESGTYEFQSQPSVDHDPQTQAPIRAEEILMEAFRMIDEWPAVRETISANSMRLKKMGPLPVAADATETNDDDDLLAGLDDAFDAMGDDDDDDDKDDDEISRTQRLIYDIITDGCSVQEVVDVSRLGEFESVKAISVLVAQGYVHAEHDEDDVGDIEPFKMSDVTRVLPSIFGRMAAYVVLALVVGGALKLTERSTSSLFSAERDLTVRTSASMDVLGSVHERSLSMSIAAFTLREGRPPSTLTEVILTSGLPSEDLHGPYKDAFLLRVGEDEVGVLRPLH